MGNRILVFEFKHSPTVMWRLPIAPRSNNSIRVEETIVIGYHEPLLAVVKEWKVN